MTEVPVTAVGGSLPNEAPVPQQPSFQPDHSVQTVFVVAKTHLDVGFTNSSSAVLSRYINEFLPRAAATAAELRDGDGLVRYRWTVSPWVVSKALDRLTGKPLADLESALEAGDLVWQALPFTTHTEFAERSLLAHGLSLSATLDDRFGRRTRAAKMTDVPGHTRALVGILLEAGVDFLHIGVNPAAPCPDVPLEFRWAGTGSGQSESFVNVVYQPAGYGTVRRIPETNAVLALDMTGDNLGPRTPDGVREVWSDLQQRFPNAQIRAASLDDVADVVRSVADRLPLVSSDLGDSWIQGVGTDPLKVAQFRALARLRAEWIRTGVATSSEPAMATASTKLLLMAEHTWGADQKSFWPDTTHWSADDLARVRNDPATEFFESTWAEQRSYLADFESLLRSEGRVDLADAAHEALSAAVAQRPSVEGMVPIDLSTVGRGPTIDLGGWRLTVDSANGWLSGCIDPAGRSLASAEHPLGQLRFRTYDAEDFERWFSTYNAGRAPEDEDWARWDNTKPGLADTPAESRWWVPEVTGMWRSQDKSEPSVVVRLGLPERDRQLAAAIAVIPAECWIRYTVPAADPESLQCEMQWFSKPAGRWPESTWWSFSPVVTDPTSWAMVKLGEPVQLDEIPLNGGRWLHCAERITHPDGVELELIDTTLVAPDRPRLLDWDDKPPDATGGWHVCLHNNVWGTNFPMWAPGDARFRVVLRTQR